MRVSTKCLQYDIETSLTREGSFYCSLSDAHQLEKAFRKHPEHSAVNSHKFNLTKKMDVPQHFLLQLGIGCHHPSFFKTLRIFRMTSGMGSFKTLCYISSNETLAWTYLRFKESHRRPVILDNTGLHWKTNNAQYSSLKPALKMNVFWYFHYYPSYFVSGSILRII